MSDRIVQCSQLGNFGRFGNQLFQYVFARSYAEKYDAVLEIPEWIGEKVFKNVTHRRLAHNLPKTKIDDIPWGAVNIDLFGYFQTKKCFDILSRNKIKDWLILNDNLLKCSNAYKKEVVAHLRRGDYATNMSNIYCVVSEASYINACKQFGIDFEQITWLSEENPTVNHQMTDISYRETKNSMYGQGTYDDKGISFLPDFLTMVNAKILLRSNSSFSFWAGFLNNKKVFSPVVKGKVGWNDVDFIEGNSSSLSNLTDDIIIGE